MVILSKISNFVVICKFFPKIMKKSVASLLIILALFVGFFLHAIIPYKFNANRQPSTVDKLSWVMDVLENTYVDSIARDSLLDLAVPFIISKLDPHSEYISSDALAQLNEPLLGKFDGIGVVFNMATDTAQILNVIPGGPSAEVGIAAGDRIVTVNDSIIAGKHINQMDVVKMLRGEKGSKVKLGVMRGKNPKLLPFTVTRGVIPISSIEASYIAPSGQGFIRLSRFAATTHNEVMAEVEKLQKQGAKGLILDLRGNGGGFLDQAIYLANEFLKRGQMIVYIEGAHRAREEQRADGRGTLQDVELTILIDEASASSSEIFAGAMQDNDRATIVGRRSFGKGLIQEQIGFNDGSAARITIARYYTPLGRPLQKPYTAGDPQGYEHELYNRYNSAEMYSADSIHYNNAKKYTTPEGRVLYGGGGITPDKFVGVDTVSITPYFLKLFSTALVFDFSREFCDRNRAQINGIKTIAELEAFFASRPNIYSDFIAYAASKGFATTATEKAANAKLITAELRAYIGRNTSMQESAFYYYIGPVDVIVQAALRK